jgi:hypothetical protein
MTETRLAQMTRLRHEVSAMASALEAAESMPGGGALQASMDTAWNALVALYLGIEDWLARQQEDGVADQTPPAAPLAYD